MASELLPGAKPTLTVFTPAYNRAYTLHLCYESLLRQTSDDFEWLVIDDGSTDHTRQLVEGWIREKKIAIRYHYQNNQGMHGAHNAAYRLIESELNVCIDSDDYLTDHAVELIISTWREKGSDQYAGIIALDAKFDGSVLGTHFTSKTTTLGEFYMKGGKGDKKLIYRTDVIKSVPEYPIFEGEKYVGLAYKYQLVDLNYRLITLNKVVCMVDYQTDGSSLNMYRQYFRNPKGFAFIRKESMKHHPSFKRRFVEAIHYVSSCIIDGNKKWLHESPKKLMTLCAVPFGAALYFYLKNRQHRLMKM